METNNLEICKTCHGHGSSGLISYSVPTFSKVFCASCIGKGYTGYWSIPIEDYKKGNIPKYLLEFFEKLKKHKDEFPNYQ